MYPDSVEADIILKEYGRIIQKLVDKIILVEDKAERTRQANQCVELMRIINPNIKDSLEQYNKLWDHLFIISNYKLDVDSPYPMPSPAARFARPKMVPYPNYNIRFKHYGRNIWTLCNQISAMPEGADKENGVAFLSRLMKRSYQTWNKDNIEDEIIVKELTSLSNRTIELDIQKVKEERLLDLSGIRDIKQVQGKPGGPTANPQDRNNHFKHNKRPNNNRFQGKKKR
jgi:hypothetical protein